MYLWFAATKNGGYSLEIGYYPHSEAQIFTFKLMKNIYFGITFPVIYLVFNMLKGQSKGWGVIKVTCTGVKSSFR